jgi:hypothetical protein
LVDNRGTRDTIPMARKLEMTWQASTKRWFKKWKGKMYTVSCRHLNCPPTKDGSAAGND